MSSYTCGTLRSIRSPTFSLPHLNQEVNTERNYLSASPMSPFSFLSFTFFFLLAPLTPSTATNNSDDPKTAYDLLQDYDFPVGILPKGVTSYTLDKKTGKFSVSFNGSCSFSIQGAYPLKYKSTIKGVISKDKLMKLEGVSVKVLLFWFNIVEIHRVDDELEFSVGILSANYEIDNFYESPQCGCGFNCVNRKMIPKGVEIEKTPFVSSS